MKIFRTILGLLISIIIYTLLSTLIFKTYQLLFLNLFAAPLIFLATYISVIIAIHIGFLIVKGTFKRKSETFLVVYALIAISILFDVILYDVLFSSISSLKLHGFIYFFSFILGILLVTKPELFLNYILGSLLYIIPIIFHIYSILIIFEKFGTIWGIICIFIPPFPEIFIFITYWINYGFINSYSKIIFDFILFVLIGILSAFYLAFWCKKNKLDIDI